MATAGLQRHLGLPAVLAVSIGAMIGSGIFVLPGLAIEVAGPGAILAYFLAGVVVVPAALSKSEMSTAMPTAGGAYVFIDRAMGPLMGTVAGVGVWFALVFKSAFALVGLGGYLVYFLDVPVRAVGVILGLALILINAVGVKQSGRFQTVVVAGVLAVLTYFVVAGLGNIEASSFEPVLPEGFDGLFAATGLVFVSYAGVTKVASVAEEVRDPGRNLPRGILGSMGIMLLLYPAIVWVVVGAGPAEGLGKDPAPIATTAEQFMGGAGVALISATAVLALISMANAGLLSSSRYPLAMARERLAPRVLAGVHTRSRTPVPSIVLTGAVMLALIALVPLVELAKLASAFQLLVFSMINVSVVAFRESNPAWYRPVFRSPLYPWVQVFGIGAAVALLTQLGTVSMVGALAIVVGGVVWYRWFGRSRASHESAALDALRLRSIDPLVDTTAVALASPGRDHVLIPVHDSIGTARLRDLLRLARAVSAEDGRITLARVDRYRQGALWWRRERFPSPDDPFRIGAKGIAEELGLDVAVVRPRGGDAEQALIDYADRHAVDLILGELPERALRHRSGFDLTKVQEHAHADVMYLGNQTLTSLGAITVLGAGSPYDVAKIDAAARIAHAEGAKITLLHILESDATEIQQQVLGDYHARLAELTPAGTTGVIERSDDLIGAIAVRVRDADLVIAGASRSGFGPELSVRISTMVDAPVLVVHAPDRPRSRMQRILERLIY